MLTIVSMTRLTSRAALLKILLTTILLLTLLVGGAGATSLTPPDFTLNNEKLGRFQVYPSLANTITIQWKMGGPEVDPLSLTGTPSESWWIFNTTHVLSWWGSGRYAEIHMSDIHEYTPVVWLPGKTVTGPLTVTLKSAKLWAEYVIDSYWDWDSLIPTNNSPYSGEYHTKIVSQHDGTYTLTALGIVGLPKATSYTIRVKQTDPAGSESTWSTPQWITTSENPDTPTPTDVEGFAGDEQLAVVWNTPDNPDTLVEIQQFGMDLNTTPVQQDLRGYPDVRDMGANKSHDIKSFAADGSRSGIILTGGGE